MKKHPGVTCFIAVFLLAISVSNLSAQHFTSMEPGVAAVGEQVTLHGFGFDPVKSYTVTVADIPAPVQDVQPEFILFTVPSGATTGPVAVDDGEGGQPLVYGFHLTVTREIPVNFSSAVPFSTSGYAVGSIYGDSLSSSGPDFPVTIAKGEPTLVMASRLESEASFMAFTTDSLSTVELGAQSTALAFIFLQPFVFTTDVSEADNRLSAIEALAETKTLIDLIQVNFENGTDYLNDPGFEEKLVDATVASMAAFSGSALLNLKSGISFSSAQNDGGQKDDFVNGSYDFAAGYPRDLAEPAWASQLNRLNVSVTSPDVNDRGIPTLGFKYDPAPVGVIDGIKIDTNPLEWKANVYELAPWQFSGGKSHVDALAADPAAQVDDYLRTYIRNGPAPIASGHVASKSIVRHLDLVDLLANLIMGTIFESPDIDVPADRSGVYVVRKFNGAYFPHQDALLSSLQGGSREAIKMASINITMAVIDTLGIVLKARDFIGESEMAKYVISLELAIDKAIVKSSVTNELTPALMMSIFKESLKATISTLTSVILKGGFKKALKGLGKSLFKLIDVPGKVGKAAKVADRMLALTNVPGYENANIIQKVESSIVIIGDPWRPEITSFFPDRGYRGTEVTISGRNFSTTAAENQVEFSSTMSTDWDPDAPGTAPAPVIRATANMLVVEVPEDACDGDCFVTVRIAGKGGFTSAHLAPPMQTFEVVRDPFITSVEPLSPLVGMPMKLNIDYLLPEYYSNLGILKDGVEYYALSVGADFMIIRAPFTTDPVDLQVVVDHPFTTDRTSNTVTITATPPPPGTPGASFIVTSLADNTNPDNMVTLREALGWASGALTREPTRCDPDDPLCDSTAKECWWISGCGDPSPDPYGAFYADQVNLLGNLDVPYFTKVVDLNPATGPLPFGSHDTIKFGRLIIDGGGMAGDGITLNNKTAVTVSGGLFRNFGGSGIKLFGTSSSNEFQGIRIESCTGNGIHLSGDSILNLFTSPIVMNNNGDGIFIEGRSIFNEVSGGRIEYNAGHGVHVSGPGASHNVLDENDYVYMNDGWGIFVESGASSNLFNFQNVEGNLLGGIRIEGEDSTKNRVGPVNPLSSDRFATIQYNSGPGVSIEASDTTVFRQQIFGNEGDGIFVSGSNTSGVSIGGVRIGESDLDETAPNLGSGIHLTGNVSYSNLGVLPSQNWNSNTDDANYISANRDHGIWLDGPGVHHNLITSSYIGKSSQFAARPNGKNGIAITRGTHHNEVGGSRRSCDRCFHVEVENHTSTPFVPGEGGGTGIFLDGADTSDNRIYNTNIHHNRYGIYITNGANSNIIGKRGKVLGGRLERGSNTFWSNTEAGIVLESGGGLPGGTTTDTFVTPVGGNVIQNNEIGRWTWDEYDEPGPNKYGILIRGDAKANRIGGTESNEENYFRNSHAGILIDGVVIPRSEMANRIIGNKFASYDDLSPVPVDPIADLPQRIGILVTGGSQGQVIGGTGANESNGFSENLVGIYVKDSSGVSIRGNFIGNYLYPSSAKSNEIGGVILNNSTECKVGPGNTIIGNGIGIGLPPFGGVSIAGGHSNDVAGNWLGTTSLEYYPPLPAGNKPYGVGILDSSANIIGGAGYDDRNVIVKSEGDGILIHGAGSFDNIVGNNFIGIYTDPRFTVPNTANGIHITRNAFNNTVGGKLPAMVKNTVVEVDVENTISGNGGDGVRIDGAGTTGNTILNNSIYGHDAGLGINNINGGNIELEPPVITSVGVQGVWGTVNDAVIPYGSIVQVFTDDGDEGRAFYGEAVVENGGTFNVHGGVKVYLNMTATVTHNGSTSEFGQVFVIDPPILEIRRTTEPPGFGNAPRGVDNVPILPMTVTALTDPIRVDSITFNAGGALTDHIDVTAVNLYLDDDGNGTVTDGDVLLGGPETFNVDDGNVTLLLDGAVVDSASPQQWLLVYTLDAATPVPASFTVVLANAAAVSAWAFLGVPAVTEGPFPIFSDEFTTTEPVFNADSDQDGDVDGVDLAVFVSLFEGNAVGETELAEFVQRFGDAP